MNLKIDHHLTVMDLPHIGALKEKLEAARMLAATMSPVQRESYEAQGAYEGAALEYLVAVGHAAEEMGRISQAIEDALA